METYFIMMGVCGAIIFSYFFDSIARKTKFPSVLLLILFGISLRAFADATNYHIENLDQIIPTLGNIGLIFIVLEGALELEIYKEKIWVILKSLLASLVVLLLCTFGIFYLFNTITSLSSIENLLLSIPFAVISSAVAIPSSKSLPSKIKEFIVYESTFSDILGIVFFNFVMKHYEEKIEITTQSFSWLTMEVLLVIIIAIVVTYLLFELIGRIKQKVKFFLILAILILAYAIGKYYHLSALIIIFIFGLIMSNSKTLLPKFINRYLPIKNVQKDLHDFHTITAESTFLIRTFFFLFFGFSIELGVFTNQSIYIFGSILLLIIILTRTAYFGVVHYKNFAPTAFIAPRGLISILLFTQIPQILKGSKSSIDQNAMLIVILGSMLWMLLGIIWFKKPVLSTEVEKDIDLDGMQD